MIAQAVEQIRNTVSLSVLDESATKQGVVLRLLSLAGWDTFDISQVVPEYTVGTRRVDYALRPGSPNAVFIEVKRPGENLERHQQQLLEYCFQEGVKLAVLTNGRTWWLYLPLQAGSWEQRRFLTIDLEVQEPSVVEHRFLEYLSPERVGTGQAVGDAEDLVESPQRAEIIGKTIAAAWAQIVETPDELLVDLISETTERICGFKPEPELVEQFLAGRSQMVFDAPPSAEEPPLRRPPEPTATSMVPTPEPTPVAIGTTVEAGGSWYTLNEVKDPAPAGILGVDAGKRLVALDITQVRMSDETDSYNALYFAVQDAEGYVYDPASSDADVDPSLGSGDLSFGQIVRGWVVIEVPETARLVSVLVAAEIFGSRVTIADLAEDQAGDLMSQTAPPLHSPPSTPVAIGTTVEAGGSWYTLNEVKDPAPAGILGVDAGKRLVALDITQVGMSDETDSYNALYFAVQDAEGYVYDPASSDADVDPSLGSGDLSFGQIVRGWVVIEVPETARLVSVLVAAEVFGSRVTIADLAEDQAGDLMSQTAPPLHSPPSTPVAIGTTRCWFGCWRSRRSLRWCGFGCRHH